MDVVDRYGHKNCKICETIEEYEYLRHLIRKENENAQRANGCTY